MALEPPAPRPAPLLLRRAVGRLRRRSAPLGDPLLRRLWSERTELRSWIADDVLRRPELRDAMGDTWAKATRSGFLEGRRRAVEKAQLAAGPFVLLDQLAALRRLDPRSACGAGT